MCAAITLGKDMTLRDYAQGAWRMRGLGQGQTLHLMIIDEVLKLMQGVLPSAGEDPMRMPADVVAYLVKNSCGAEAMQESQLLQQNLSTIWRRRALSKLMSMQSTLGDVEPDELPLRLHQGACLPVHEQSLSGEQSGSQPGP